MNILYLDMDKEELIEKIKEGKEWEKDRAKRWGGKNKTEKKAT